MPFRAQAPARAPWTLNSDFRSSMAQTVNNNQLQMALYYGKEWLAQLDTVIDNFHTEYMSQIAELKQEIAELKKFDGRKQRTVNAKSSTEEDLPA